MADESTYGGTDVRGSGLGRELAEELRVLVVAGIPVGVLVAGVGSRLAMLLLRVTSSDGVRGLESDDGFTIGQVTLAGTYNLLLLGAAFGVIGAAAYQVVARWLIGPTWFRRLTVGLASAVVVGSMLVHSNGIDFRVLKPTWLAIGVFVLLPGLFGVAIGVAVDRVERPGSWTRRGRRRWVLPPVVVLCFPLVLPILVVAAVVLALWIPVRDAHVLERLRSAGVWRLAVRAAWLTIAVLGLIALMNDISSLA